MRVPPGQPVRRKGRRSSLGEEFFLLRWRNCTEFPTPEREYVFAPPRKWRFDFAWSAQKVAVEIEGGVWSGGRHTRPATFEADCEKYNEAAILGWRVLRFSTEMVLTGEASRTAARLFAP